MICLHVRLFWTVLLRCLRLVATRPPKETLIFRRGLTSNLVTHITCWGVKTVPLFQKRINRDQITFSTLGPMMVKSPNYTQSFANAFPRRWGNLVDNPLLSNDIRRIL